MEHDIGNECGVVVVVVHVVYVNSSLLLVFALGVVLDLVEDSLWL